jgi:transposase-like protein
VDYAALKERALQLAREGHSQRAISRELGVQRETVRAWLKAAGFKPKTFDKKQETLEALQKVLAGLSVAEVARDMGIDPEALRQRLSRFPEYRKFREKERREFEEKREQVLKLARQGYSPAVVARTTGLPEETVYGWIRRAGISTNPLADDDFPCPECGGRMSKQELFFWKCCSCGAEWWPPEEMVPEDPDDWIRPWRLRTEDAAGMLKLIKRLHDEGRNAAEIAEILNQAGYKTFKGLPWKRQNLVEYMKRHGIMADSEEYRQQRERIEEIIKSMAPKGYNCQQIAERLNAEGFKTNRGQDWTKHNVWKLLRRLMPDIKLQMGAPGIPHVKLQKPEGWIHPWRLAEDAGVKAWKARKAAEARRRENALPDLPGGNDVH